MNQKWELFTEELRQGNIAIKEEKFKNNKEFLFNFIKDKLNKDIALQSKEYEAIYKYLSKNKIKISGESVKTCLERFGYKCEYHKENLFVSE